MPARNNADPDRDSPRLRCCHELLWTKELPSGVLFAPRIPSPPKDGYLILTDSSGDRHWYGSDAITSSYTKWLRPKLLVEAIAGLNDEQRARYLNPPYTIGSSMIWPVRKEHRPTMNQARGLRLKVADRMDLTLECIRRYYARGPKSPLSDVIDDYEDFFKLFKNFKGFVDFFHFQDLVTPDYENVRSFLEIESFLSDYNFERPGTPATTEEYVTYREATLDFIAKRGQRMADWVTENHPGDCGSPEAD